MAVWFDKVHKRWRIRIKRRGKEIARYLPPGVTRQQAEEAHTDAMRQFFDQVELNKQPRRSLADALVRYMEEYNVNLKHPQNAESNIRALLPFIEGRSMDAIADVANAVRKQKQWSPATRNRRIALLRRVSNLAYAHWKWIDRPVVLELLPERNERQVRLTAGEVRRLAEVAGGYLPIAGDWILIAAYTGLRRGEIASLTAGSVQCGVIHLRNTKNERPRAVPIHPKARKAIHRWVRSESRPNPRWLYRQFERARTELQLGDVRFHDLRHFFASELINAGVDVYTTGRILGHKSATSTQRYAHLDLQSLTAAVRRVK